MYIAYKTIKRNVVLNAQKYATEFFTTVQMAFSPVCVRLCLQLHVSYSNSMRSHANVHSCQPIPLKATKYTLEHIPTTNPSLIYKF